MLRFSKKICGLLFALSVFFIVPQEGFCCSEIYLDSHKISCRTFDFMTDEGEATLWPRGIARTAQNVKEGTPLKWKSRYGSLTFDALFSEKGGTEGVVAGVDGINEKGLKIGTYFLESSNFPVIEEVPNISITSLPQYFLDSFATVDEVIDDLKGKKYSVTSVPIDMVEIKLHLYIHDMQGESAVVEFIDGKMVITRNPDVKVMTNDQYGKSVQTLKDYVDFGGKKVIPGGQESLERFVRGAFYMKHLPEPSTSEEAREWGLATIQVLSIPPMFPHGCTRWTIISDIENMTVYIRSLTNPELSYIDLKDIDFSSLKETKTVDFQDEKARGDITDLFRSKA